VLGHGSAAYGQPQVYLDPHPDRASIIATVPLILEEPAEPPRGRGVARSKIELIATWPTYEAIRDDQ
jgi:hypothetical protein